MYASGIIKIARDAMVASSRQVSGILGAEPADSRLPRGGCLAIERPLRHVQVYHTMIHNTIICL